MELNNNIEFGSNFSPDLIFHAIEKYNFQPTGHCIPLNSLENRVYYLTLEESSNYKEHSIVVKFYRPNRWSKHQIQEEHLFLEQLQISEIPVIAPIRHPLTKHTFSEMNGLYYTIFPNQKGRLVEEISRKNLPILGRLLARIHNIGESKIARFRNTLTVQDFGISSIEFLLNNDIIPNNLIDRYKKAAYQIFDQLDSKLKKVPYLRIHGDCHKGNLIQLEDSFCFIDFDDFVTGPAVQDLWMLLPFEDEESEYDRELFLEGYREFRDFSDDWWSLVEPLRGLRYIYYATWIARRWHDPSFHNAFPNYGTEDYWLKETDDLEMLSKGLPLIKPQDSLDTIPINHSSHSEEKIWTNKDYFYDL
jgi:Ser/Thr protein kinase RdoA (MazF antagonist)